MRRALGSRCTKSLHLAAYIPTTKLTTTRAAPAGKLCAVHHVLACLCDQGAPSVTPSRRRYDVRTLLWAARSRTKELRSSTFETLQQSIWRMHRVGGITLDRARTMLKPWDTLGRKRLGVGAKLTDLSTDLFIDPAQLQDPMRSAALDGLDAKDGMRKRQRQPPNIGRRRYVIELEVEPRCYASRDTVCMIIARRRPSLRRRARM